MGVIISWVLLVVVTVYPKYLFIPSLLVMGVSWYGLYRWQMWRVGKDIQHIRQKTAWLKLRYQGTGITIGDDVFYSRADYYFYHRLFARIWGEEFPPESEICPKRSRMFRITFN